MMRLQTSCPEDPVPFPESTVLLTMWETTRISPRAVANCNQVRALIVPCQANAEWFRDSGVTVPIRVVPLGIDPDVFYHIQSPKSNAVRFGCGGRTAHGGVRKGLDSVIAAWLDVFDAEPRAYLDVKVWPDCEVYDPCHPRVNIFRRPLTDAMLANWYRSLDVFVSASRGEGWGMQPHQAMACGVPVIAPFWGGHADYMTPDSCYPIDYDVCPATGPIYGGLGDWCVPRHASLVDQMYRAFHSRDDRRRIAIAVNRARDFTWQRTGIEVHAVLREFFPKEMP